MGMMDMAQMPQEPPQQIPDQGMMQAMAQPQPAAPQKTGNPTTSHGNFNGVVEVDGKQVEVKAGIAQVEGQPYFISDNGRMIVNAKGQLVGHIDDGKFVVVTEEYARKMHKEGYA